MVIFFNFSPTSSHLHPLQAENCDSNSRLVVDEDDYGKLESLKGLIHKNGNTCYQIPGKKRQVKTYVQIQTKTGQLFDQ